jgi:hypothetical protein
MQKRNKPTIDGERERAKERQRAKEREREGTERERALPLSLKEIEGVTSKKPLRNRG